MEKEFVPYELALRMKQIGFDEPCFGLYAPPSKTVFLHQYGSSISKEQIDAPLYQQAFRWFRDKYRLNSETPYLPNVEKYFNNPEETINEFYSGNLFK